MQKMWHKLHKYTLVLISSVRLISLLHYFNKHNARRNNGGSRLMLPTAHAKECLPRATTYVRRMLRFVSAHMDLPSIHLILSIKCHAKHLRLLHTTGHKGRTIGPEMACTRKTEKPNTPMM